VNKYRRIEVNAFRRRVTIVSGEWPAINLDTHPAKTEEGVSLDDSNSCAPVEPDSPEGQVILVEAVRSLERRLTPEARAMIRSGSNTPAHEGSSATGFYLKLQSFYLFVCPDVLRFVRRKK
jgi:hypothetical protein